jgi:hypothetical protein
MRRSEYRRASRKLLHAFLALQRHGETWDEVRETAALIARAGARLDNAWLRARIRRQSARRAA